MVTVRAKQLSCSFTGHRPEKLPWGNNEGDMRCCQLKERLYQAVLSAYEQGFRNFMCGMARGCDFWFCEAVLRLREIYSDVTMEAIVPYRGQESVWNPADQERYRHLLSCCNYKTILQERYSPECMHRRNNYLVNHAAMLVAVHDGLSGGTQNTIIYAIKQGIKVVNFASTPEKPMGVE